MGDNHVLSPILPTQIESDKQPDFPPRLIQRADALCYSLPMLAPDGSRCHVVVVGSFAAWGETMTALVREGFVAQDEPGRKFEPGAWAKEGRRERRTV